MSKYSAWPPTEGHAATTPFSHRAISSLSCAQASDEDLDGTPICLDGHFEDLYGSCFAEEAVTPARSMKTSYPWESGPAAPADGPRTPSSSSFRRSSHFQAGSTSYLPQQRSQARTMDSRLPSGDQHGRFPRSSNESRSAPMREVLARPEPRGPITGRSLVQYSDLILPRLTTSTSRFVRHPHHPPAGPVPPDTSSSHQGAENTPKPSDPKRNLEKKRRGAAYWAKKRQRTLDFIAKKIAARDNPPVAEP